MSHKVFATTTLLVLGAASVTAYSDDTGLAASHDLRRERGRVCFLDHWHYGSSSGQPNKKAAEKAALVSWASFVDLEYGSDWARVGRAASKVMACEPGYGGGWNCNFEARPCR